MRPVRIRASAEGASQVVPPDIHLDPFNISVAVVLDAGATMTYTVEHTFDDVFASGFNPSTATWFPNTGLTAKTASSEGNYVLPVTGIRLNVTAYTDGAATMIITQAGVRGGA